MLHGPEGAITEAAEDADTIVSCRGDVELSVAVEVAQHDGAKHAACGVVLGGREAAPAVAPKHAHGAVVVRRHHVEPGVAVHVPCGHRRGVIAGVVPALEREVAPPVAPRQGGQTLAKELYEVILPLAAEFDCPIAGGDTNSWDGPLVVSITAFGAVPPDRRWRRSGARPGDAILVTGSFGGSILGKQFDFRPRVREALWLAEHADIHAAIDVSDGLSLDLSRICEASGCGAAVSLGNIPIAKAAVELAAQQPGGLTPLEHALGDGEDFELILAVPPEQAKSLVQSPPPGISLTEIGRFIEQPGLFAVGDDLRVQPLAIRGYEHRLDS